ncbi:hypothetical protein [Modestobacter sp. SYSU DS0290]
MSQPHPPIPEPQPAAGPPDDEPRTQSILLPPSQRQTEQAPAAEPAGEPAVAPAPVDGPPTGPAPVWTPAADQPAPAPADHPPADQPAASRAPGVDQAAAAQGAAHRPTGPVDFVPGFGARPDDDDTATTGSSAVGPQTAVGVPPVPGPSTAPRPSPGPSSADAGGERSRRGAAAGRAALGAVQRAGGDRTVVASLALGVLGLLLLELGLALDFGLESVWEVTPTWSAFATLAALVALVPALRRLAGDRLSAPAAWRIGAGGAAGVAAFWVLVALPLVASDRGFLLTAALAAVAGAVWLAPGRPR